MDFYDRVKLLVKEKNTTIQDLIQSLEINFETYRSGKRFGNLPRADDAVKIAKALNTTVEYLVTGVDSNPYKEELEKLKAAIIPIIGQVR